MKSEQACKFIMPFGMYEGQSLEIIATTDPKGPGYLDWLVGSKSLDPNLREALKVFLTIPWVSELVDRATEKHTPRSTSEPVENFKKPKAWWE